ncbi:hypothetical protein CDAR_11131 [Caerostris darwini]|uniref:Sodium/calcium exchanger membrane region domain-containing protein n=1 Tax=Caerostris darwini TaxID=1538125 RepID=A0AAV4VYF8_9ARAC|nr:hypothetical protein CDAR_11131 [Caerostris darwini]
MKEGRSLLEINNDTLIKCIPSGIDSFPDDFFTQEERQIGGVIIHVFIAAYTCAMIGIVCHDYFVPSLEIISEREYKTPPDIAGATFMAIGTSAPELFSSITGSFITEGDIGIGTIIGSAVFNIVGVTGLVGLVLWKEVILHRIFSDLMRNIAKAMSLDIDWYPIARDCIVYGVTVFTLIWIIADNIIHWWEAFVLLMIFFLYIIILYYNVVVEEWSRDLVDRMKRRKCCCCSDSEETPLLNGKALVPELIESQKEKSLDQDSFSVEFTASRQNSVLKRDSIAEKLGEILSEEEASKGTLCSSPTGGGWRMFWWVVMYPAKLVFFLTVPDSRKERLRKLFPLTFTMSVVWIGVLSYLAVWMVTLLQGTSVPEIISSIIVAKNGFGNMAISNLVGSNTFDISFCLGAPWLLKTLISGKGYLIVFSSALTYTTATLIANTSSFYISVCVFRMETKQISGLDLLLDLCCICDNCLHV